jgi:hypothetical protein
MMVSTVMVAGVLGAAAALGVAEVWTRIKGVERGACLLMAFPFMFVVLAGPGFAEIPQKINYQGRLVDGVTGEPLVGPGDLTFRLYDAPMGGDTLWTESQTVSADSSGVFSCLLGARKPVTVSFGAETWLEVEVNGEVLQPRRELASVPYAFMAQEALDAVHATHASDADSLDGRDAGAFAEASHNHDDRYYTQTDLSTAGTINQTGNPVDWSKLKDVPTSLADGVDDVGSADGYSLDAADGDPTDAVYVDNAGNVGIGTLSPTLGRLQVENPTGTGVYAASNDGTGIFGFSQTGTGVTGVSNNGYAGSFVGDVYVSGNLGVDTSVGIGTPAVSPDSRLHVDNPSNSSDTKAIYGVASSTSDAHPTVGVYGETKSSGSVASSGVYGYASGSVGMSDGVRGVADGVQGAGVRGLATDASGPNVGVYGHTDSPNGWAGLFEGGRSYFGGNVGIGITTPERKLHIRGEGPRVLIEASAGSPEVNFKTAGDAVGEIWAIYKHSSAEDLRFYQNGDRVTIQNNTGNVGIGTINPGTYKLYVNGEAYATTWLHLSDARLKTDLQPIEDALSKVTQLRGLSFLWRRGEYPDRELPEGRHYGLVAQDVEQVLPEAVKENSDGEKAIAYSELIPVLVESIKELKIEMELLRTENSKLQARLDALETR